MKNLNRHTTFSNIINLLVVAGILCLLAPNAVDRNRETSFEEWLESSHNTDIQSEAGENSADEKPSPAPAEQGSKHEITSLYAAWYYFHQSVTLGHGVFFDAATWKHIKHAPGSLNNSDLASGDLISIEQISSPNREATSPDAIASVFSEQRELHHSININAP